MDWKRWYREEAESDAGRDAIARALARFPEGDPDVRRCLRGGGAVSFPHTTLAASAEPLARTATSILAEGCSRVVAIGVLHGSTLPERWRALVPLAGRGDPGALAEVGGAFLGGGVATGPSPVAGPWVREGGAILEGEFSLDLFLAVLAAASRARCVATPSVTRVFVGTTVLDDGASEVAARVAAALAPLLGPRVALVATGDLVHAGYGYSSDAQAAALPSDPAALRAHFEPQVRAVLEGTLLGGEAAVAAGALAREIRSDQRHVLPVLAGLLGPGASARLLSFHLTDYGTILGRASPCVVASALAAFDREVAHS